MKKYVNIGDAESYLSKEEETLKNKWLKKGMVILTIGCIAIPMTGCKAEKIFDKVLEKSDSKKEENKTVEKKEVEPEVPVEKPQWTTNLSGSVTYEKDAEAEALQIEATASDSGTISYQWYKSLTNTNGGGTAIEGETSNTFTPPTNEIGTVYYYVVAINTIGSSTNRVTSETMEVIVSEAASEETSSEEGETSEQGAEGEAAEGSETTEESTSSEEQPAE